MFRREGRIKYREDIVDDLENVPEAFKGMLAGKNFGKLLVRVANLLLYRRPERLHRLSRIQ
jgi:NADPH-dependent curcumin reductase CurA